MPYFIQRVSPKVTARHKAGARLARGKRNETAPTLRKCLMKQNVITTREKRYRLKVLGFQKGADCTWLDGRHQKGLLDITFLAGHGQVEVGKWEWTLSREAGN